MEASIATEPWTAKGTLLIACNCDYGCPCNVNGQPTSGDCEGGWIWQIDAGRYGDTALDGLAFSIFADWPGAIHEGGGKAVSFFDERATAAQQQAIATLAHGLAGGPWATFITTYELDGPHPATHDVELAGERSRCRVGESAELELRPIANPVTGEAVHPRLLLPEGHLVNDLGLFASQTFRVKNGITYDHSGRYAAMGAFEYSGA